MNSSAVIPESLLYKGSMVEAPSQGIILNRGTVSGEDQSAPINLTKYQVAIYAEDAEGNYRVYTGEEFTLPEPAFEETPTVKITADEITLRGLSVTFEVENGSASKVIRGFCLPYEHHELDWDTATEEEIVEVLKKQALDKTPYAWTGTAFTEEIEKDLEPGWPIYVYAAAITADGKVGKLCYERFVTETPVMDGTGTVTMEFINEEPFGVLNFRVTLGNGAVSARINAFDPYGYSVVQNELDWVFSDIEEENRYWYEYTAEDLTAAGGIVQFNVLTHGGKYYYGGVALTADGKISPVTEMQSVLSQAEAPVETIDYTLGKGEARIIDWTETTYCTIDPDWGPIRDVDVTYKVEKGANTEKVYILPCSFVLNNKDAIIESISSFLDTEDMYAFQKEFTAFGEEQTFHASEIYTESSGGYAVALVTVDTDGNYAVRYTRAH